MKKTFKVIMVLTEKASKIHLVPKGEWDMHRKLEKDKLLFSDESTPYGYLPQHLYITSNSEIKEGDWCILLDDLGKPFSNEPQQWLGVGKLNNGLRKVIASTDTLHLNRYNYLPIIPDSFIQVYIKSYNEGKPITEVDLEVQQNKLYIKPEDLYCYRSKSKSMQLDHTSDISNIWGLKTRPDNTVIIHQSKTYTRQEVEELCRLAFQTGIMDGMSKLASLDYDKWIEEHLK